MPRQSTAMPAPKTKEELWAVICHLRDFSLPELLSGEGLSLSTIRRHVAKLVKSGHLREEAERNTGVYKRYHVLVSRPPQPTKEPTGRQRMWMGMKAKKVFDYREVAFFATVPLEAARLYCYALRNAGYLIVRRPATANGTPELYRFNTARDTGLHAPRITRDKKVLDPNLGQIVWPKSEGA